jgi:hypothetical protein
MSQSRLGSFIEALANVAIGYGVALASQLVIFPHYGVHVSLAANVEIGLWFTAVSIARSYCVRRLFNRRTQRPTGLDRINQGRRWPRGVAP